MTAMKQQSNVGPFALKPDPTKESAKRGNKKLCVNKADPVPADSLDMGTSGVVASLSLLVGGGVLAMLAAEVARIVKRGGFVGKRDVLGQRE